ncbi:hypothetical protein KsCSTR_36720 [Candidatus Kuenenia stuttgartiensis]|uniref:Uncharacterized protein n=1 Tax=Kuenenia stuttgartiensis TaxID=174633 RepID=Q1Q6E8_KUEST|nr:hypothetical protein KsCSTR_36720 [Candidatus Kuenenia stuttgartiensis]CAJ73146.1 unknown protein [Candidatus Kuenenia stuttgartiensis]
MSGGEGYYKFFLYTSHIDLIVKNPTAGNSGDTIHNSCAKLSTLRMDLAQELKSPSFP